MAEKVEAWRSKDGALHNTECEAAERNIELLVKESPLSENEPYARKVVEWLTRNPVIIRKALEAHERACPRVAEETPAVEELERDDDLVPGVSVKARGDDLIAHMPNCRARRTGWFKDCACGALSPEQIEGYRNGR